MASDPTVKYRELVAHLQRVGSAKVQDLSRELFLSESTVRRALLSLEQEGKVKRFHGGASLLDPAAGAPVLQRKVSRLQEKQRIGQQAASLVREGMTLLLMGGTSVQAMCPYIKGKRLTVITSSLTVMNELAWEEQMTVILLGGVLNPAEMEVRGGLMQLTLERLRADIMFTGTTGVHPIHGLMTDDPNGVETYRTCMRISDEVVVLADHTKLREYWGMTVLCDLSEINCLITDSGAEMSEREYYHDRVKKLVVAEGA